jgi:hypothetical protein
MRSQSQQVTYDFSYLFMCNTNDFFFLTPGDIQTEVKNLCDNVSGQPDTQPIDEPDDVSEKVCHICLHMKIFLIALFSQDKSFASVCNDSFNLSILESADHIESPNRLGSKTQVFAMKRPITGKYRIVQYCKQTLTSHVLLFYLFVYLNFYRFKISTWIDPTV